MDGSNTRALWIIAVVTTISGCSLLFDARDEVKEAPTAIIAEFGVSPSSIKAFDTALVDWSAPNTVGAAFRADDGFVASVPAIGAFAVAPLTSTRYELEVDDGEKSAVNLRVDLSPPRAFHLDADRQFVTANDVFLVRWRAVGTDISVRIEDTDLCAPCGLQGEMSWNDAPPFDLTLTADGLASKTVSIGAILLSGEIAGEVLDGRSAIELQDDNPLVITLDGPRDAVPRLLLIDAVSAPSGCIGQRSVIVAGGGSLRWDSCSFAASLPADLPLPVDLEMTTDGVAPALIHARIIIPRCGNGIVESTESCDDGGVDNGDGCDFDCRLEPNFQYSAAYVASAGTAPMTNPVTALAIPGQDQGPAVMVPLDPPFPFYGHNYSGMIVYPGGFIVFDGVSNPPRGHSQPAGYPDGSLAEAAIDLGLDETGAFSVTYESTQSATLIAIDHGDTTTFVTINKDPLAHSRKVTVSGGGIIDRQGGIQSRNGRFGMAYGPCRACDVSDGLVIGPQ